MFGYYDKNPQHDPKIVCKIAGNIPQKMHLQQSLMFLWQITDGKESCRIVKMLNVSNSLVPSGSGLLSCLTLNT